MSTAPETPARHAALTWDENGQPSSTVFGDVYFSREAGIAETEYVFLEQNRLAERFAALPEHGRLVIGETGFGTGLNFLCAWDCFLRHAPATARLEFVTVEKYPLTRDDLARALALWPSLAALCQALLGQYQAIHEGFQRLLFDEGRVGLTLMIGDALEHFRELDATVDAWFLDGFAPAKNPDMWTPELIGEIARLSVPGTTFGTFTTTGFVKRAVAAAGFTIKKLPGQGKKWEIMRGEFQGWPVEFPAPKPPAAWYARPQPVHAERHAMVIGAGLAGCCTAAALASRGWRVTLLERHAGIAEEASGNAQGVLYLKLSAHGTALSRLILAGFGHTRRLLERLQQGADWQACGVLQLAFDAEQGKRQAQLAEHFEPSLLHTLERSEAEAVAGVALEHGGLYFPEGGWVHPPALCAERLNHPLIERRMHHHVLRLQREGGQWQALDDGRCLAQAPVVVLANAAEVLELLPEVPLALKRIRGQITHLPATEASSALKTVVCADGYVAPARLGEHTLGASFDFHRQDTTPTLEEHAGNLERLKEVSTDLAERLGVDHYPIEHWQGRAAFRCTTPDYLPLVGPVADPAQFESTYPELARDARQQPEVPCPWLEGLYLNSGHGSRGLITAPISAELVAAWVDGTPLPVPRAVAEACHPNRFAWRRLTRGQR